MTREPDGLATTDDAVLGGRLMLRQPRRGHRVGHDAILLAAATGAGSGERAVDLGAGVGAAGLALAARVPGLAVTLVEIDPALAALADDNIRRNGFADRVRVVALDVMAVTRAPAAAGLPGNADRVLMNPPFNDPAKNNPSPDAGRRRAHVSAAGIAPWLRSAGRLLCAGGTITLIWRADDLADLLAAFAPGFGAVTVQPVHPRPGEPAIRVLARATKGSRAPLSLLPGLTLAAADGRPSPEAEAVLRHGVALPLADL